MRFVRDKSSPKRLQPRKAWHANMTSKRGVTFGGQYQYGVYSVFQYFEKERDNGGPLLDVKDVRARTAAALKISKTKVTEIVQIGDSGAVFLTPGKTRPRPRPIRDVDEAMKQKIRSVIYDFAAERRSVRVAELQKALSNAEDHPYRGCDRTLYRILHDIGFEFRTRDPTIHLRETPYIVSKRIQFLKRMKELLDAGIPIIYLDETWTFRNGTGKTKEWQDDDPRSCSMKTASTGERYLVCDAGGKEGFVPGASLFFRTAAKPQPGDDFHGQFNGEKFRKWFKGKLLSNLHEPCAIVMDNASYHSMHHEKQPTTGWTKAQLQQWLDEHHIVYPVGNNKSMLWELCKANKKPVQYELDEFVAAETNHEIVRLPPYHAFYNPIELVWSKVKRYFDLHVGRNNDFSLANTEKIWAEALATATPEFWKSCVEHTEKLILRDYAREVGESSDRSYQLHIICDDDDGSIDINNFDMMEFKLETDSDDEFSSPSLSTTIQPSASVCRSLFNGLDTEMMVDASEDEGLGISPQDIRAMEFARVTPLTSISSDSIPDQENERTSFEMGVNVPDDEGLGTSLDDSGALKVATVCPMTPPSEDVISDAEMTAAVASIIDLCDEDDNGDDVPVVLPEQLPNISGVPKTHSMSGYASSVQDWLIRDKDDVIPTAGHPLRVADLKTLCGKERLNDNIINNYLSLVGLRSASTVHVFNSHFYPKAVVSYDKVKRWTKNAK